MTPERVDMELFGEEGPNTVPARSACSSAPTAERSTWTRSATCRWRPRAGSLRVLVDQRFRRVGGAADVQVDVEGGVLDDTGLARRDRRRSLPRGPVLPPERGAAARARLSERREDISELVNYFIERIAGASGLPRRKLADDAIATLQVHPWPGNVRQLINIIERILIHGLRGSLRSHQRRRPCRRK